MMTNKDISVSLLIWPRVVYTCFLMTACTPEAPPSVYSNVDTVVRVHVFGLLCQWLSGKSV